MTSPKDTGDLTFIVKDEKGEPVYRIRPYASTYLHYVIDEWREVTNRRTKETRLDWVQLECYPSTLEYACTKLRDWLLMRKDVQTSDLTEIKKAITRSTNQIMKAIKEVTDG